MRSRRTCGAADDALDGGAADAVFLGEVGQAGVVVGVMVSAVDRLACGKRQFRLFAFESALGASLGHALAGAQVAEIGFELSDHGEGLEE